MTTIIDPPSGWRYGFPRPLPNGREVGPEETLEEWLVSWGYPKEDAEWAAQHCRYWEAENHE